MGAGKQHLQAVLNPALTRRNGPPWTAAHRRQDEHGHHRQGDRARAGPEAVAVLRVNEIHPEGHDQVTRSARSLRSLRSSGFCQGRRRRRGSNLARRETLAASVHGRCGPEPSARWSRRQGSSGHPVFLSPAQLAVLVTMSRRPAVEERRMTNMPEQEDLHALTL